MNTALKPLYLEVIDESTKHSVPKGSESHFKVVITSHCFEGLSHIERHRIVQDHLKKIFEEGLHALTLTAKTPEEWNSNPTFEQSPKCAKKK